MKHGPDSVPGPLLEPEPLPGPTDGPVEFDRIPPPRGERVSALLTAFSRLTGMTVRLTAERADGETVLFDGFERAGSTGSNPIPMSGPSIGQARAGGPGLAVRSESWATSEWRPGPGRLRGPRR